MITETSTHINMTFNQLDQNNFINFNSDRIIRDNSGHAMGYEVPKPDGGVNYFDLQGHRKGYQGPGSHW